MTKTQDQILGERAAKTIQLLKKKARTITELLKLLKITPEELKELLIKLGQEHPGISRSSDQIFIEDSRYREVIPLHHTIQTNGRIGVLSCTHFGSKFAQITALHQYYQRCKDLGVDTVLHCGDLLDGEKVYRGHRFEQHLQGFSDQRDFAVANYPRQKGIRTYVISGNHDDSFVQYANIDAVAEVCFRRDDMDYLGRYGAYVLLNGLTIVKMHHGGPGGMAYARSYKMQKYVESFTSENKPQVYLLGHFHVQFYDFLRNIHCFQVASFQGQTPYLVRKNLDPQCTGWIIEAPIGKDGWSIDEAIIHLVPFYREIKDDWKHWV